MADFLLIADPDPERRARHLAAAEAEIARGPYAYPLREEVRAGDGTLVVWRQKQTPFEVAEGPSGARVIAVGAYDEAAFRPATAAPETATRDWLDATDFGFCVWMDGGQVRLASDRLGLFPVYVLRRGDVWLAGSTPSLLVAHPVCGRAVDRVALAGILSFGFPSGGRTLWEEVRRLPPGHEVVWERGGSPRTREVWKPGGEEPERGIEAHARAFEAPLRVWAASLEAPVHFQLSGGLDSRLLAGFLAERPGAVVEAWTYGRPNDLEARAAAKVAHACGFPHRVIDVDTSRYPAWARAHIDGAHLTNTVTDFAPWAVGAYARRAGGLVATGHLGDIIMGGNHIGRGIRADDPEVAFALMLDRVNKGYGLPEAALAKLMPGGEAVTLVDACVSELFEEYLRRGDGPDRRGWWFDLLHRDRLMIGGLVVMLSRFSWPSLPYCRPAVLDVAAATPLAAMHRRRLQRHLVAERFPRLAELPLDRGQLDLWPIRYRSQAMRWGWRVKEALGRRVRKVMAARLGIERRVNHRMWNVNRNPGWLAIRREAQAMLPALADLLSEDEMRRMLPPPEVRAETPDALGGAGLKTLAGLAFWADRYRHPTDQTNTGRPH